MAMRKELREFDRGMINGASLFEHSEREIAAKFQILKSTVHDVISKYEDGIGLPKCREGRPRKSSAQRDRLIGRLARKSPENGRKTLATITHEVNATSATALSERTIQRRLHEQAFGHV